MRSSYIEWCNDNEERAYPLRDESRRQAANGRQLPDDILADVGIIVPPEYADVYCSSVRITARLYSVAFACSAGPLLAATVSTSAYTAYSAVALTPLVDNVSGWVVFGAHRAVAPEHYIFTSVADSGVEDRCKRIVSPLPVRRLLRLGSAADLYVAGLVRLLGNTELSIAKQDDDTIVLSLDTRIASSYAGPCNKYADGDECGSPPIRTINGVHADDDGTIILQFVPFDWVPGA